MGIRVNGEMEVICWYVRGYFPSAYIPFPYILFSGNPDTNPSRLTRQSPVLGSRHDVWRFHNFFLFVGSSLSYGKRRSRVFFLFHFSSTNVQEANVPRVWKGRSTQLHGARKKNWKSLIFGLCSALEQPSWDKLVWVDWRLLQKILD